jgi:hypothetical protein
MRYILFILLLIGAELTAQVPIANTAHVGSSSSGLDKTDLISWWSFDEASGDLIDQHGSDDGTVTGASYGATGKIEDAFDFERSGETDYITLDAGVSVGSDDFAACGWVYLESLDADYSFFGGNSGAFYFQVKSGGGLCAGRAWYSECTTTTMTISYGSWCFVGVAYDQTANSILFYANGSTESESYSTEMTVATQTLGAQYTGDWSLDGLMDEWSFWDKAMDSDDFDDIYNSGNGMGYE